MSHSRLVEFILLKEAAKSRRFSVVIPESRPNCEGSNFYKKKYKKILKTF